MDQLLNTITIEKAKNGYIVYENMSFGEPGYAPRETARLVFESMEALTNYMNKNFKIEIDA